MEEKNQSMETTEKEEKLTDNINGSVGEISLEQFKKAIDDNLEIKGYFDSLVDKTVNTRLNKGIESWKEQNLNNLIENEINKRYPQKTAAEKEFEKHQAELNKVIEEKENLKLQIKYQEIMSKNELPLEVLKFIAGKDIDSTLSNIEQFKGIVADLVSKEVRKKIIENPPIPEKSQGRYNYSESMWG